MNGGQRGHHSSVAGRCARTRRHARPPRGGPQDLFYATRSTKEMPRMVRGEGIHLWDDAGTRYIDVASGAFLANLGQGNERVLRAMFEQGRTLSYCYVRNTRHDANLELADRLSRLAGPGYERVHLSSGGSEAVEMAVKFLRQYAVATGQATRHRVITLMPSYHGATLQTIAMTGDGTLPAVYGPMAAFSEKVPAPLTCRAESPEAARARLRLRRRSRDWGPKPFSRSFSSRSGASRAGPTSRIPPSTARSAESVPNTGCISCSTRSSQPSARASSSRPTISPTPSLT
jgi:4-aminobutyrate aminotransferase-like enzyme